MPLARLSEIDAVGTRGVPRQRIRAIERRALLVLVHSTLEACPGVPDRSLRPCRVTAVRLSPGDVIGRAFEIYRDQIGVLLPAALLVFAVNAVVSWVFDHGLLTLAAAVVSLVLTILYEGMVVQLVRDVQDGQRDHTMGELFSSVSPVLPALIAVSILAALGIGIGMPGWISCSPRSKTQ